MVGAGTIGEALLTRFTVAGHRPVDLAFVPRKPRSAHRITRQLGIAAVDLVTAAAFDVVILAVKPQDSPSVLSELSPLLHPSTVVVSLCAGISTATVEMALPAGTPVVRAMPNTPLVIGEAITVLSPGAHISEDHLNTVQTIMAAGGKTLVLSESHQNAVTAISGSGPAYFFYLVSILVEGAISLGLSRDIATELVVQTAYGASALLRHTGQDATALCADVTSAGGTTSAALSELDKHHVPAIVFAAVHAANDRSARIAGED